MRILILGSGAREHAIASALARSPQQPTLLCLSSARNPGIQALTTHYGIASITDPAAVTAFAKEHAATLAIIGPEAPLAAGIADALNAAGIPTVGPTQSLARIESSKAFTRNLLAKHNIPANPHFQRFEPIRTPQQQQALEALLAQFPHRHVIKDDGLAGGKGVKVCGDHLHTHQDSLAFCLELSALNHPFVVEEKLEGEEFSLLSFCDGLTLAHMPAVQDHKRAFNGDRGPNTGGMGSYSASTHSLPFLTAADIRDAQHINQQVAHALATECRAPYQGILYGGFIATAGGVRLIEYNARFGDPEALNLLTLLQSDFAAICHAITTQTLASVPVTFAQQSSVCKYLVPNGYPDDPRKGDPVHLPTSLPPNVTLYLSAVDLHNNQTTPNPGAPHLDSEMWASTEPQGTPNSEMWASTEPQEIPNPGAPHLASEMWASTDPQGTPNLTPDTNPPTLIATGSRTLAIVATAANLSDAEILCEQVIETIPGPFFHRTDIGTSTLLQRRIDHMHDLRR